MIGVPIGSNPAAGGVAGTPALSPGTFLESQKMLLEGWYARDRAELLTIKPPRRKRKRRQVTEFRAKYLAYLDSDEWMAVRERLFAARGRNCEECGVSDRIQVHHLHYRNLFCEKLEDLQVLCFWCHGGKHPDKVRHLRSREPKMNPAGPSCTECGAPAERLHWCTSVTPPEGFCFDCGALVAGR